MTRKKEKNVDEDETYTLKIYKFTQVSGILAGTSDSSNESEEPMPRSGHRIQCTDTCLYSVGGYRPMGPEQKLFHEVWRFDFVSRNWTKLHSENLPEELASCSTLLSGNVLFLYGGTGVPFGGQLNESLYFCNLPKSGTSIKFQDIKLCSYTCPTARYGHSMALNGRYLYTVGGTTGNRYSMDVHSFNIQTSEWKKLYDCTHNLDGPKPRYRHEMVSYKDRLYIFGGGTSTASFSLEVSNDCW